MRIGGKPITVEVRSVSEPSRSGVCWAKGYVTGCKDPIAVKSTFKLTEGARVLVRPSNDCWLAVEPGAS